MEGKKLNVRAGGQLLEAIRRRHPEVPVAVFASADTVDAYGNDYLAAGASIVTASFVVLSKGILKITANRFRQYVQSVLEDTGDRIQNESSGLDHLVRRESRTVGMEVKGWRLRPTDVAVERVWARFRDLLSEGTIQEALLVVMNDRLTHEQKAGAPENARVVEVAELPSLFVPRTQAPPND